MGFGQCSHCGDIHHDSEDCGIRITEKQNQAAIARLTAELAAAKQERDALRDDYNQLLKVLNVPSVNTLKPHWRCSVCGIVAMPLTDDSICNCADPDETQNWVRVYPATVRAKARAEGMRKAAKMVLTFRARMSCLHEWSTVANGVMDLGGELNRLADAEESGEKGGGE